MAEPLKSSIGIWAFGPLGTRFLPAGYHPEVANERPLERARRVAEGLHDLYDGIEFHYSGEIDEENADDIAAAIRPMDIYCLCSGAHTIPRHGHAGRSQGVQPPRYRPGRPSWRPLHHLARYRGVQLPLPVQLRRAVDVLPRRHRRRRFARPR